MKKRQSVPKMGQPPVMPVIVVDDEKLDKGYVIKRIEEIMGRNKIAAFTGKVQLRPNQRMHTVREFSTGKHDIVLRISDLSNQPRFFTFVITETDVHGMPLMQPLMQQAGPTTAPEEKADAPADGSGEDRQ
jgi:hypothetical protein